MYTVFTLFSIYAEVMMIEALEDMKEGVLVGGQFVSDVMNKLNDTVKKLWHEN